MCDLKATRQIFDPLQTFSSSLFTLHVKEGSTWVKLIPYLPPQKYQAWQTCNTGIVSELSLVGLWNFQNVRSWITWISFWASFHWLYIKFSAKISAYTKFPSLKFLRNFHFKASQHTFPSTGKWLNLMKSHYCRGWGLPNRSCFYGGGVVFLTDNRNKKFHGFVLVIFFLLLVSKQGRICCLDCEWRIGALFGLWMEFWGTLIRLANLSIWEADPIFNLGCCCFRGHKIEPVIYG